MNVKVENEEEDIEAIMNLKSTNARSSIYATVSIIELPNSLPDLKGGVPTLRYLCIFIMQERFGFNFEVQSQDRSAKLVGELLEPLKFIQMAQGGRFDVITQGWRVPYELSDILPFRVVQERPPPLTDLANRTLELGDISQSSYLKLASIPWPLSYRPYSAPTCGLPTPAPT